MVVVDVSVFDKGTEIEEVLSLFPCCPTTMTRRFVRGWDGVDDEDEASIGFAQESAVPSRDDGTGRGVDSDCDVVDDEDDDEGAKIEASRTRFHRFCSLCFPFPKTVPLAILSS